MRKFTSKPGLTKLLAITIALIIVVGGSGLSYFMLTQQAAPVSSPTPSPTSTSTPAPNLSPTPTHQPTLSPTPVPPTPTSTVPPPWVF